MASDKINGKVAVIGQGHVGLRVALSAAAGGWLVTGYDIDEVRAKELASGDGARDGIDQIRYHDLLHSGRYRPTAHKEGIAGYDVVVIAVPTPVRHDGSPDMSHIEDATRLASEYLHRDAVVSVESTLYPGATRQLVAPILQAVSGLVPGADFHLGYSPERVDTGNLVFTFDNTPKIVSGINDTSLEALDGFYSTLVDTTVRVSGLEEAELAKLVENTFRQVNVALVNEIAMAATGMGIDAGEALRAAGTKPFGYMEFHPGIGAGGHCLLGASSYLSWQAREGAGCPLQVVDAAMRVNASVQRYVVERVAGALGEHGLQIEGSRVLVLGLAYKPGVSETANSPAVAIVNALVQLGAVVSAADPHARECPELIESVMRVDATSEEAAVADAVVLLVQHDEFDIHTLKDASKVWVDALYVT
ncbi:MAG: nucleotide sugar dehydrogenase [Actinobacteria bacterium]|jgi:UDP-N-acetyl-D-glucosamine dehydrogenase|nr:nucleotide sugar dehydrogenase [Actinomycetota bacterium]